jgi:hypothetical protein
MMYIRKKWKDQSFGKKQDWIKKWKADSGC